MLGAQGDENLVEIHPDTAFGQHADMQLVEQPSVVGVHAIGEPGLDGAGAVSVTRAFAPLVEWEQRFVELTVDERVGIVLPVAGLGDVDLTTGMKAQASRPVQRCMSGVSPTRLIAYGRGLEVLGHEVAAALLGIQKTLVHQFFVGQHDGVARYRKLARQLPTRRDRAAGGNMAFENGIHDDFSNPLLKVAVAGGTKLEESVAHTVTSSGCSVQRADFVVVIGMTKVDLTVAVSRRDQPWPQLSVVPFDVLDSTSIAAIASAAWRSLGSSETARSGPSRVMGA